MTLQVSDFTNGGRPRRWGRRRLISLSHTHTLTRPLSLSPLSLSLSQTDALATALAAASVGADRDVGTEGGGEVALVDLERVYQVSSRLRLHKTV